MAQILNDILFVIIYFIDYFIYLFYLLFYLFIIYLFQSTVVIGLLYYTLTTDNS